MKMSLVDQAWVQEKDPSLWKLLNGVQVIGASDLSMARYSAMCQGKPLPEVLREEMDTLLVEFHQRHAAVNQLLVEGLKRSF